MSFTNGYDLAIYVVTTTSNATPQVALSIPVTTNQSVSLYLFWDATQSDYSASIGGDTFKKFTRGAGNITQQGTSIDNVLNGFSGQKPSIDATANTGTQSIDVTITGRAATNINWRLGYYLKINP